MLSIDRIIRQTSTAEVEFLGERCTIRLVTAGEMALARECYAEAAPENGPGHEAVGEALHCALALDLDLGPPHTVGPDKVVVESVACGRFDRSRPRAALRAWCVRAVEVMLGVSDIAMQRLAADVLRLAERDLRSAALGKSSSPAEGSGGSSETGAPEAPSASQQTTPSIHAATSCG